MPHEARERAESRARVILDEMRLEQLRKARDLTQAELADLMNTTQAQISKLERRADLYVGTLRAVVEAMGGHLEITARFPDGEVRIGQFAALEREARTRAPVRLEWDEIEKSIVKNSGASDWGDDNRPRANFTRPIPFFGEAGAENEQGS